VAEFELRRVPTAEAQAGERALMHALFDANYAQANHAYLDKSFDRLRFAAIATYEGVPAGFALGDMRIADLPRLPSQAVAMAGICCIAPAFRRRGLFGRLEALAMTGPGIVPTGRVLSVGRMAHPASMRTMVRNASAVPKPGVALTAWQREVGRAIAQLYGTAQFDDTTLVCIGDGTPIGYPVMEIDVEPEEWQAFEAVDRDRGDSLLGLGWRPDAPDGWNE
jgi:hypothetical protein